MIHKESHNLVAWSKDVSKALLLAVYRTYASLSKWPFNVWNEYSIVIIILLQHHDVEGGSANKCTSRVFSRLNETLPLNQYDGCSPLYSL